MSKDIQIRLATREDSVLIESFIRKLATYENALYRTSVTPELIEECGVYRLEEEDMREMTGRI